MMSAAHRQAVLVRERRQIMWVRRIHDKPNQCAALFLWTKGAGSRQFPDALHCITCKMPVVFENRRTSDLFDVINCGREANRAGDIGRASFKPMRRSFKRSFFQGHAYDHFTATMPWRHRIENLRSSVKRADASRATHLVSGKRQKIAAQLAHINRHMSHALRCVHQRECAHSVRFRAEVDHRINCAQRV